MDEGDMGLDEGFHYIRLECCCLSHPDCNSDDDCPSCCQSPCAKSKAILESRVSCYSCCYGYWSRLSSLSVGISFHYHL